MKSISIGAAEAAERWRTGCAPNGRRFRRSTWILQESRKFIHGLASVPGFRGADIAIGIEPRCIAILARHSSAVDCEASPPSVKWADDSHFVHVARDSAINERTNGMMCAKIRSDNQTGEAGVHVLPAKLFCVLTLPAEVEPSRSIAVISKGVLGIRMPKKLVNTCN